MIDFIVKIALNNKPQKTKTMEKIVNSKIRDFIFKLLLTSSILLNSVFSIFVNAQQMMYLGANKDLKYVLSNADAAKRSREIRLKMMGNIDSYYNVVGGVAFTQQAVPNFKINSINLEFSENDKKGYAIINGERIHIPLEMYEMRPIVNYANSEYDVAMTMYGASYGIMNEQEFQDILFHPAFLDNMMGIYIFHVDAMADLEGLNGSFFKTNEDNFYISDKEYEKYLEIEKELQTQGTSYSVVAQQAYKEIDSIIGGKANSYIYTDIEQPIHFSAKDNGIVFEGLPYYQFSTTEIDTLGLYYSFKNNIRVLKEFFAYEYVDYISEPEKTDKQNAEELLEQIRMIQKYINNPIYDVLIEAQIMNFSKSVSADDITDDLRAKPELVRALNPVIYEEVDDICQWTAFFRYVKSVNPSSWSTFVEKVNQADYETPAVTTPIMRF